MKTVAQKAETVAKSSVKKLHLNDSDIDSQFLLGVYTAGGVSLYVWTADGSDSGGESVVPVAPKPKTR